MLNMRKTTLSSKKFYFIAAILSTLVCLDFILCCPAAKSAASWNFNKSAASQFFLLLDILPYQCHFLCFLSANFSLALHIALYERLAITSGWQHTHTNTTISAFDRHILYFSLLFFSIL